MNYEDFNSSVSDLYNYFSENQEMARVLDFKTISKASKALQIIDAFKNNNNVLIADNAEKKLYVESIWHFYYDINQLCVDENVNSGDWESNLESLRYYRNVDIPYMILDINTQDSCRVITYEKLITTAFSDYPIPYDIFDWEEMLEYEVVYEDSKWNPNWRNEKELKDDLKDHLLLLSENQ